MQVFKKNPKESEIVKGFYEVPDVPGLLVNKLGHVYNMVSGKIMPKTVETCKQSNFYLHVGIHLVHRLVAETFLSKEHLKENEIAIINHIDGNKRNNRVENLEWTNYSGNITHAYASGLRTDNIPIEIRDVETGEVSIFYSYWDCARKLGTNGASVWNYLNRSNRDRLFRNKYEMRTTDKDWEIINLPLAKQKAYLDSNPIFLLHKPTKKCFIFDNIAEASDFMHCAFTTLNNNLIRLYQTGEKSVDINEWVVMFLCNAEEWFTEKTEHIKRKPGNKNPTRRISSRINVFFQETGITKQYSSLQEFSNILGIKKDTMEKHIYANDGWFHDKYRITYLKNSVQH